MEIIIGLGNIGIEYKKTRHNLGFMVIDYLADLWSVNNFQEKNKLNSYICQANFNQEKIILAKPNTMMNNSGQAVYKIKSYYKSDVQDLIVIHDDKDLDLGKIKIKKSGSDGGHNGIKSIIENLNTKNFIRIKIGLEQTNRKKTTTDFVLDNFNIQEQKKLPDILDTSKKIVETIIDHGVDKAMNKFN